MTDLATATTAAANISTIVKDITTLGRGLVSWNQTIKQNPKKLKALLKEVVAAKNLPVGVQTWLSAVPLQSLMQPQRNVIDCRLGSAFTLHEKLQEQVMRAVEEISKKRSTLYPSVVNEFLRENQQALTDLSSEIIDIASAVKDFEVAANENKKKQ